VAVARYAWSTVDMPSKHLQQQITGEKVQDSNVRQQGMKLGAAAISEQASYLQNPSSKLQGCHMCGMWSVTNCALMHRPQTLQNRLETVRTTQIKQVCAASAHLQVLDGSGQLVPQLWLQRVVARLCQVPLHKVQVPGRWGGGNKAAQQ
jgi:hypothetical protein